MFEIEIRSHPVHVCDHIGDRATYQVNTENSFCQNGIAYTGKKINVYGA